MYQIIDLADAKGGTWKHGYIPTNAIAVKEKQHGRSGLQPATAKLEGKSVPAKPKAAPKKAAAKAKSPVGKDARSMTPTQKIKAAEIMHGTGSKQHKAAQAKFKPVKKATPNANSKLAKAGPVKANSGKRIDSTKELNEIHRLAQGTPEERKAAKARAKVLIAAQKTEAAEALKMLESELPEKADVKAMKKFMVKFSAKFPRFAAAIKAKISGIEKKQKALEVAKKILEAATAVGLEQVIKAIVFREAG